MNHDGIKSSFQFWSQSNCQPNWSYTFERKLFQSNVVQLSVINFLEKVSCYFAFMLNIGKLENFWLEIWVQSWLLLENLVAMCYCQIKHQLKYHLLSKWISNWMVIHDAVLHFSIKAKLKHLSRHSLKVSNKNCMFTICFSELRAELCFRLGLSIRNQSDFSACAFDSWTQTNKNIQSKMDEMVILVNFIFSNQQNNLMTA